MKVVVSLTSIPSRFAELGPILKALSDQVCHEVWLNVPLKYNRFPEWDGHIPAHLEAISPKIVINRDCPDFGPGTKFIGPALKLLPEDLIIYVDDDTIYAPNLATQLLKWHQFDQRTAWGLSGFTFENYFNGYFPRTHGTDLDVLEGYGSVIVKAGIKRKAIYTPDCNLSHVRQFQYGFGSDALHVIAGPGGHKENNKKILEQFKDKGKLYYNYTEC